MTVKLAKRSLVDRPAPVEVRSMAELDAEIERRLIAKSKARVKAERIVPMAEVERLLAECYELKAKKKTKTGGGSRPLPPRLRNDNAQTQFT